MATTKTLEIDSIATRATKRSPSQALSGARASIVPGKSIRLHGVRWPSGPHPRSYDRTFEVGDVVTHDSYNLVYLGTIEGITAKTVSVRTHMGARLRRMSLYDFSVRNWDFDREKTRRHNSAELECI